MMFPVCDSEIQGLYSEGKNPFANSWKRTLIGDCFDILALLVGFRQKQYLDEA